MRLGYTIIQFKENQTNLFRKPANEGFYPWRNISASFQDQNISGQTVFIIDHKSTVTQFDLKLYEDYSALSHHFPIVATAKIEYGHVSNGALNSIFFMSC